MADREKTRAFLSPPQSRQNRRRGGSGRLGSRQFYGIGGGLSNAFRWVSFRRGATAEPTAIGRQGSVASGGATVGDPFEQAGRHATHLGDPGCEIVAGRRLDEAEIPGDPEVVGRLRRRAHRDLEIAAELGVSALPCALGDVAGDGERADRRSCAVSAILSTRGIVPAIRWTSIARACAFCHTFSFSKSCMAGNLPDRHSTSARVSWRFGS